MLRGVLATEFDAGLTFLRLRDLELDAAVLLPSVLGVSFVDGAVLAVPLAAQPRALHAAGDERADHRVHAALRQRQVVLVAAALVGVPSHFEEQELGVVLQRGRDGVEDLVRRRQDLGRVVGELDLVEDDDAVVLDDDAPLVGAAVLVFEAVERLRLVGALVDDVGDAVLVVVRIGAAVLILEAVLVFRIVRTLVHLVGDAILVVVGIGATIFVLEAVAILRVVGALVLRVENAVPVAVALAAFGAAVFVVVAVAVLGDVDAAIVDVGDAVVVVVRVRTAVSILEAVEVLGIVGALVDVVLDTVAVTVTNGWFEDKTDERSRSGRLETRRVSGPSSEHQVGVSLHEDLETAHGFVTELGAAVGTAGHQIRPVRFPDQIERLENAPRHAAPERGQTAVNEGAVGERESRRAGDVSAVAAIERDSEFPLGPESLLDDELRPIEKAWVGAGVGGGGPEAVAHLYSEGEPKTVFDARDAPLGVGGDVRRPLEVQLVRTPLAQVCSLRLPRSRIELLGSRT